MSYALVIGRQDALSVLSTQARNKLKEWYPGLSWYDLVSIADDSRQSYDTLCKRAVDPAVACIIVQHVSDEAAFNKMIRMVKAVSPRRPVHSFGSAGISEVLNKLPPREPKIALVVMAEEGKEIDLSLEQSMRLEDPELTTLRPVSMLPSHVPLPTEVHDLTAGVARVYISQELRNVALAFVRETTLPVRLFTGDVVTRWYRRS